ncbi:MAG: hypothetical protein A3I66_11020 [Burkholderiales bacterium RIFCSPLOWO2_02_FULL_57_36]|nr:MAG: hypothetical protein A3I66_11020 [Burkholderiales bacterium RIFCSPLOWO2_02_FULL_57_36]
MTKLVEHFTGRPVHVDVLSEGRAPYFLDERSLFDTAQQKFGRVREIALMDGDMPLLLARTLIPSATAQGRNRRSLQLGNKPLGQLLFQKKSPVWKTRQMVLLNRSRPLWKAVKRVLPAAPASLWGRRTMYLFRGHPLLVTEIFLPALLQKTTPLTDLHQKFLF